jgi:hypothetical protein
MAIYEKPGFGSNVITDFTQLCPWFITLCVWRSSNPILTATTTSWVFTSINSVFVLPASQGHTRYHGIGTGTIMVNKRDVDMISAFKALILYWRNKEARRQLNTAWIKLMATHLQASVGSLLSIEKKSTFGMTDIPVCYLILSALCNSPAPLNVLATTSILFPPKCNILIRLSTLSYMQFYLECDFNSASRS